jgi:hypothetical protein
MPSVLLFPVALLLGGLGCGLLAWELLDRRLTTLTRSGTYAIGTAPGRCARKAVRWHDEEIASATVGLPTVALATTGALLELRMTMASGRRATLLVPRAVAVRPGDHIRIGLDARGRVVALENAALGTGWRLPVRGVGDRSALAFFGLVPLAIAAPGLAAAAFGYALVTTLAGSISRAAWVMGKSSSANTAAFDAEGRSLRHVIVVMAGIEVVGAVLLLLRRRPPINRGVETQLGV